MPTQQTICPVCNSAGFFSHGYESDNIVFSNKEIYTCPACHFSWGVGIYQKDLNDYYQTTYDAVDFNRSKRFLPPDQYFAEEANQFKPKRSKQHLELAKRYLSGQGRIEVLDCGAGLGTTLHWARQYFDSPVLHAYENDLNCHEYLKYIGANITSGDPLESLRPYEDRFDLIICSHFLEHVSADCLSGFVGNLYAMLKIRGALMLEVPHVDWVKYPHTKQNKPPHVGFYSKKAIRLLFEPFDIHLCGAIRGSVYQERNWHRKIAERIYGAAYHRILNLPYALNGRSLILCASRKA